MSTQVQVHCTCSKWWWQETGAHSSTALSLLPAESPECLDPPLQKDHVLTFPAHSVFDHVMWPSEAFLICCGCGAPLVSIFLHESGLYLLQRHGGNLPILPHLPPPPFAPSQ